jgi:hypothetical protein
MLSRETDIFMNDHERLLKIAATQAAISILEEQKRKIEVELANAHRELERLKAK